MYEDDEKIIKKMLETWVSRDNACFISSYNFIREDSGYYTVSVMETDVEDSIWLSIYRVEINDLGIKILEFE